jgi:hypothetical protein
MYLKIAWVDSGESEVFNFRDREAAEEFLRENDGEINPEKTVYSHDPIAEGLTVYHLLQKLQELGLSYDECPIYLGYNGTTPINKVEVDGRTIRLY